MDLQFSLDLTPLLLAALLLAQPWLARRAPMRQHRGMERMHQVEIEPGQWLAADVPLRATAEGRPLTVKLSAEAAAHPALDQMPEGRPSITAPRDAIAVAGMAATRALHRGSVDGEGCVLVRAEDLVPGR